MNWLMFFAGMTTGMFLSIGVFLWIARSSRNSAHDFREKEDDFREQLLAEHEYVRFLSGERNRHLETIAMCLQKHFKVDEEEACK